VRGLDGRIKFQITEVNQLRAGSGLSIAGLLGVFMDSEKTPSNKATNKAYDKGGNEPIHPQPIERLDDVIEEREIAIKKHRSDGARQNADEEKGNCKKPGE
jgi:hypothetical protein